jgi:hypothetical protein
MRMVKLREVQVGEEESQAEGGTSRRGKKEARHGDRDSTDGSITLIHVLMLFGLGGRYVIVIF